LLCTLHDKLRNGGSFFYSWEGGLGDGFLPTYFYYLSSPINLLVVFVNKSDIRSFIHLTIVFRMTLSATAMSAFLSPRFTYDYGEDTENDKGKKNSIYIIPLACAYALSGFVFGFYHESMWLDSYMIFPVILLGYDRLTKQNKPGVYILSLVYSSLCSFYMTFMIGFFLVIWFLLDEHDSFKAFLRKGILFGVSSALAIGMTALSILVSYIGVMKTHVEDEPDIIHKWFGNIFNIIRYQFPLSTPINVSYDNNCANLYCGLFTVMLVFVYVFTKKIKVSVKLKRILIILFLLISMNEAILNFIWHGFHYQLCIPNRFAFIMIFVMLLTAYETLEAAVDIKTAAIGLIIAELFPIVSYFFNDFDSQYGSKTVLIVSIVLVLLYGVMYILHTLIKKTAVVILFSVFMLAEVMVNATSSLSYDLSFAGRYDQVLADSEKLISEISHEDNTSFYRSKLLGTILANTGNILGVNGVQSFNSMMNSNMLRFATSYGIFRTDVAVDENGGYEPLDDILGVRYLYSAAEVFPSKAGYELAESSNTVEAYRNNNALSLGYAVNKDIKSLNADDNKIFDNINRLSSSMAGCRNILDEVIPEYKVIGDGYGVEYADVDYFYARLTPTKSIDKAYVRLSFDTHKSGLYNMYMNYSDYGIVTIYVNNDIRRYEFTSFGGILNLGTLEEGDKVDVFIQSENTMADGYSLVEQPYLELRFVCINEQEYNTFINTLKSNEMNISSISGGHINASVSIPEGKMLFTSIPYDDSWHVYEDGKELQKEKLVGTFIGLDLGKGEHELEFKYVPGGFYPGLIITVISWIAFVVFMLRINKKEVVGESKEDEETIDSSSVV
ncbi:MAG: YfhO family protein, partial [Eubacterium sp.]|nr:YfhO family protein [Eubacterium sp.]